VIPSLIPRLNGGSNIVRSATVSALAELADHGQLVVACYLGIVAGFKLNVARQSGQPFHRSLCC
jgi:hypothetical protein